MNNTQLLCTFTTHDKVETSIKEICEFYEVVFGKIYVLGDVDNKEEKFLTYNVNVDTVKPSYLQNTISVHRKKDTNTLYTINSLNALVKELNNGIFSQTYRVDWEDYRNCLLVTSNTNDSGYKQIGTKLNKIVKLG